MNTFYVLLFFAAQIAYCVGLANGSMRAMDRHYRNADPVGGESGFLAFAVFCGCIPIAGPIGATIGTLMSSYPGFSLDFSKQTFEKDGW